MVPSGWEKVVGKPEIILIGKCQYCETPRKFQVYPYSPDANGIRTKFYTKDGRLFKPWNNRYSGACESCRSQNTWNRFKGVLNEEKRCGARCMSATGPSCECSCGGTNHGGAWS